MSTKLPDGWIELTAPDGGKFAVNGYCANAVVTYSGEEDGKNSAVVIQGTDHIAFAQKTYEEVMDKMVEAMGW